VRPFDFPPLVFFRRLSPLLAHGRFPVPPLSRPFRSSRISTCIFLFPRLVFHQPSSLEKTFLFSPLLGFGWSHLYLHPPPTISHPKIHHCGFPSYSRCPFNFSLVAVIQFFSLLLPSLSTRFFFLSLYIPPIPFLSPSFALFCFGLPFIPPPSRFPFVAH